MLYSPGKGTPARLQDIGLGNTCYGLDGKKDDAARNHLDFDDYAMAVLLACHNYVRTWMQKNTKERHQAWWDATCNQHR